MDELGYFEDPGGQLARSRAKPYGWHGWLWTSGSTSTSQLQRPRNARARLGPRTWQFLHGGSLPARRSLHDRRDRALPSAFPPRPLPTASVSANGFASAKPFVAKRGSRALELDQLGLAQFEAELVGRSSPWRDTDKAAIVERASWGGPGHPDQESRRAVCAMFCAPPEALRFAREMCGGIPGGARLVTPHESKDGPRVNANEQGARTGRGALVNSWGVPRRTSVTDRAYRAPGPNSSSTRASRVGSCADRPRNSPSTLSPSWATSPSPAVPP